MTRAQPRRGRAVLRQRYASQLWQQYLEQASPAQLDRWLARALRQYPKFGRNDRRIYRELLFAAARFAYIAVFVDFARQQQALAQISLETLPAVLTAFEQEYASPEVAFTAVQAVPPEWLLRVVGLRYQREPSSEWPLLGLEADPEEAAIEHLLSLLQQAEQLEAQVLWQGIPLSFAAPLAERALRSGWSRAESIAFLQAQPQQPPLWLRLNQPQRQQQVLQELVEHGLQARLQGEAIEVRGERSILALSCYQEGAVEIQDWASQQIGLAVAAKPGELIWDACAGGGGKSVQLAVMLAEKGLLYASDIRQHALQEAERRVQRAGFSNIKLFDWDGGAPPAVLAETALQQGFDRVLVDAPCTSSGIWRRSPDARFRATAASLEELTVLQLQLLSQAAAAVRSGGQLVYSTCSWLVAENEAVVEAFLAQRPEFRLERCAMHGSPAADADTMFSAVLHKLPQS